MTLRLVFALLLLAAANFAQSPPIEPGVSHELAKWRAANYSDVRYKLNLTLEKMSPVLKGTIEIRVKVQALPRGVNFGGSGLRPDGAPAPMPSLGPESTIVPIILDWRKIKGSEHLSAISNVSVNGRTVTSRSQFDPAGDDYDPDARQFQLDGISMRYEWKSEHLIFSEGVVAGENVIKLDFTSPILTSGSAITRYIDKEDGAEYIYSLFVPSDASTAFPVFDQPDLKGRFSTCASIPKGWTIVSNESGIASFQGDGTGPENTFCIDNETKPISTYVFAFAAGPFQEFNAAGPEKVPAAVKGKDDDAGDSSVQRPSLPAKGSQAPPRAMPEGKPRRVQGLIKQIYRDWKSEDVIHFFPAEAQTSIYVRRSQAAKFKPHAAEVFRLNREGIRYLETYFDYKFPFPKYDIVLIPEFPFGGMEHAGATFLRESSVIFPTEPTKGDHISRANLIFHEAAHQWFGDTVTMRWFDDLWLKEGFAEFMAYKTLEKVMPDANAWKVFYERNKQAAYATDSTKGTTPIYQKIDNLSAAKSAYGNIVYRKAPSFLRQAEFYIGEDKFQTAVRSFLKKYEFGNAKWEDLVREFGGAGKPIPAFQTLLGGDEVGFESWAERWIKQRGLLIVRASFRDGGNAFSTHPSGAKTTQTVEFRPSLVLRESAGQTGMKFRYLVIFAVGSRDVQEQNLLDSPKYSSFEEHYIYDKPRITFLFPNYQDYGYGIFLLDDKSREYVLKNIQNEKDPFLRSMMYGALWDSVREGELDPRKYVELAINALGADARSSGFGRRATSKKPPEGGTPSESDESITTFVLGRVTTAMNYYLSFSQVNGRQRVGIPHVSKGSTLSNDNAEPSVTVGLQTRAASRPNDLQTRFEEILLDRLQNAPTPGQRITFYRAFVQNASTSKGRQVLKQMLRWDAGLSAGESVSPAGKMPGAAPRTKDKFDILTRLIALGDPEALKLLADLEKTETGDDAKRYAYAARAAIPSPENKAKYWNDFVNNKDIPESWIEAALPAFNNIRHAGLTQPYLERALAELPNLKRTRKIFFINNWLAAFIGGQRDEAALAIVNKFLAENPNLGNDLRLKILENVDLIERAVKIRETWKSDKGEK